jgi:hypothetical protein
MKRNITPGDVNNQYIETGLILWETTLSGDYKKGNKEGKKIVAVYKLLEKDIDLAKQSLPKLFYDENIVTRTKVAAHCLSLGINIEQAVEVLEQAASDERNGIFGFNAKMTLKVWREQGYLKVYPNQKNRIHHQ